MPDFNMKIFSKFSYQLRWTDDFSNMKSDNNTMKKPSNSEVDRFCPNKGIARTAAKSGAEQDNNSVLVVPIIRELSKKMTQLTILNTPFPKIERCPAEPLNGEISMPKGNTYAPSSSRSPNRLTKKVNVMAPTSYKISDAVSMNAIKQNKPTMLIANP